MYIGSSDGLINFVSSASQGVGQFDGGGAGFSIGVAAHSPQGIKNFLKNLPNRYIRSLKTKLRMILIRAKNPTQVIHTKTKVSSRF